MKNAWELKLKTLGFPSYSFPSYNPIKVKITSGIPKHYELRPGSTGPVLYCGACAREISGELSLTLDEAVNEAQKHEEINHSGHKSAA